MTVKVKVSRRAYLSMVCAGVVAAIPLARASEGNGTPEEAQAMAVRAAQLVEAKGLEGAKAELAADTSFKDRDLYVFVFAKDGTMLYSGAQPTLVGKNLLSLKDPSGFAMVQSFVSLTQAGWVDYQWADPLTHKLRPKSSYIIPVNGVFVGVGAYKAS